MRKLLLALAFIFLSPTVFCFPVDTIFYQPASQKFLFHVSMKDATPTKVVVDRDDKVYVLTDRGVARIAEGMLVKDLLYRPLQDRQPVDIAIQEGLGFLYYLLDDVVLTNAHAGKIIYTIPSGTYTSLQVARGGQVLLHGPTKMTLIEGDKRKDLRLPPGEIRSIHVDRDVFYAVTSNGLFVLRGTTFSRLHQDTGIQAIAFSPDETGIVIGTAGGYYVLSPKTGEIVSPLKTKIPIRDVRHLATSNGRLWAGTPQGAFMEREQEGYDYYASKRWLVQDSVLSMAAGGDGQLYFLSADGVSKISFQPYTYLGKAKYFQQKIRDRHIRYGLLAEARLKTPGDLTTAEMIDTDNDGLWSSFYLGGEAFRYAVTGDQRALSHVWQTFEAYERLISVNPLKGFPSRTFERTGFKVADPKAWRLGTDTAWEWKGTTSSDEFVGYIFIAALMDQLITTTPAGKKRVADFMDQILTHIIENDYNFVDADGKHTRWGRWHPDYINSYAKTISDRKLGSTHLIAGLQLGYALTGKEIYKTEALRMMKDHGYLENILISPYNIKATEGYFYDGTDMGIGPWNHSDDEMEFLSFWVLHHYAFDKNLQQKYGTAIREFWEIEKPERHPVWNLITYGTEGSFDKESTLWYLREFPMDLIRWDFKNSIRKDLDFLEPNFRRQYTREVLSPRERPANRFNANEFTLDGGQGGRYELTGAEYLLSYWMARYLKVIE